MFTRPLRNLGSTALGLFCRACIAAFVLGGVASADPIIEVRGRMRIELDHVERHERTLTVSGRLLDEVQNEPMGGWTIALRAGALDADGKETFVFGAAMPADVDGNFVFRVAPVSPTRYLLHLTAPGDAVFTAAAPIDREIDLGRRAVELRLLVPAEQPARALTLPVSVEAVALDRSTGAPTAEEELAVDLELDGVATATLLLSGGRASTQLALPRAAAGRELVVRARFAGDATRSPAEATQRVRLVEDALLTLTSDGPRAVAGSEVVLRGRLTFGDHGIGGLPVAIHSLTDDKDTVVLVVTTDPTGAFEGKARTPNATRAAFEAHFADAEAKARSLPAARSELLVLELNTGFTLVEVGSRPAGSALAVAGLLLAALALLRVGAWLAPRRKKTAAAPAVPGAPRPRATLRSPTDRRVSGRVLDSDRAQPLAAARVVLGIEAAAGATTLELFTDARGTFEFSGIVDGSATLAVTLAGFAPLRLVGKIPHRGEWTAVDLRLVPLRAEILRLYGAALAPYVPGGASIGLRTPRELARAARFVPGPAVAALRRLVEDSCYGPAGASEAVLARVHALSAELPPPQSNQS